MERGRREIVVGRRDDDRTDHRIGSQHDVGSRLRVHGYGSRLLALRLGDREHVERRNEEEVRRAGTCNRRQRGRPDAPLGGSDNNGDQVSDRNEVECELVVEQEQHGRDEADACERHQ